MQKFAYVIETRVRRDDGRGFHPWAGMVWIGEFETKLIAKNKLAEKLIFGELLRTQIYRVQRYIYKPLIVHGKIQLREDGSPKVQLQRWDIYARARVRQQNVGRLRIAQGEIGNIGR